MVASTQDLHNVSWTPGLFEPSIVLFVLGMPEEHDQPGLIDPAAGLKLCQALLAIIQIFFGWLITCVLLCNLKRPNPDMMLTVEKTVKFWYPWIWFDILQYIDIYIYCISSICMMGKFTYYTYGCVIVKDGFCKYWKIKQCFFGNGSNVRYTTTTQCLVGHVLFSDPPKSPKFSLLPFDTHHDGWIHHVLYSGAIMYLGCGEIESRDTWANKCLISIQRGKR